MENKDKLSRVTITLHWIVALAMITMVAIGFYMMSQHAFGLISYHKSMGVIVLVVAFVRVLWRYHQGWPEPVRRYPRFEHLLAHAVHWILILATLLMPLSGLVSSVVGGKGISVFGVVLIAANRGADGKPVAFNEFIANAGGAIHTILAYVLLVAIILHVIGALKHHWIDKDDTLKRMLGRRS